MAEIVTFAGLVSWYNIRINEAPAMLATSRCLASLVELTHKMLLCLIQPCQLSVWAFLIRKGQTT